MILEDIKNFLFPSRCSLCHSPGIAVCDRCRDDLMSYPGLTVRGRPPLKELRACSWHTDIHRAIMLRYKVDLDMEAGKVIGLCMIRQVPADRVQAIVPVPANRQRLLQRGFDPATELAVLISEGTGLSMIEAVSRVRDTSDQTELAAEKRIANVSGAFGPDTGLMSKVSGIGVLLVDDVAATGATLAECAAVLLDMGVRHLAALVFTVSETGDTV